MGTYYLIYGALTAPVVIQRLGVTYYRALLACSMGVLAFFTWVKGPVGTDAGSYLAIAGQVVGGGVASEAVEPGFLAMVTVLAIFTDDAQIIVNSIGLFIVLVSLAALLLLPTAASVLVYAVYVPFLLVDGVFNSMRLGAALAILLVAYYEFRSGKRRWLALLLVGFGISIQFTTVLPVVLVAMYTAASKLGAWLYGSASVVAVLWLFSSRIDEKFELYTENSAEKGWSGLAIAAIAVLLFVTDTWLRGGVVRALPIVLAFTTLLCAVPNPYGFLTIRISQLVLFGLLLIVADQFLSSRSPDMRTTLRAYRANRLWLMAVVLFCVSSVFRLRNIADVSPYHLTPYVPFVWRY